MNSNPYVPLQVENHTEDVAPPDYLEREDDTAWAFGDRLVLRGDAEPPPTCARTNRGHGTMEYPDCALGEKAFGTLVALSAVPGGVLVCVFLLFTRMMGQWYRIRVTHGVFGGMMLAGLPLGGVWFATNMGAIVAVLTGDWLVAAGLTGASLIMGFVIRWYERREFNAVPVAPDFVVLSNVHPDYLAALPKVPDHLEQHLLQSGLSGPVRANFPQSSPDSSAAGESRSH